MRTIFVQAECRQTCLVCWGEAKKRKAKQYAAIFAQAEHRSKFTWLCWGEAKNRSNYEIIAAIAQLVEHNLAKVRVASSSLVCRSKEMFFEYSGRECPGGGIGRRARFRCVCRKVCRFESCSGHSYGEMAELVDALLWGGSDSNVVWVRVSFSSHT